MFEDSREGHLTPYPISESRNLSRSTHVSVKMQREKRKMGEIEIELQRMIKSILRIDASPEQPLMEIGMDSLAAVEMQNAISISFHEYTLPTTFVFDYPTIEAMVHYFSVSHMDTPSALAFAANEDHETKCSAIVGVSSRYPANAAGETFLC